MATSSSDREITCFFVISFLYDRRVKKLYESFRALLLWELRPVKQEFLLYFLKDTQSVTLMTHPNGCTLVHVCVNTCMNIP